MTPFSEDDFRKLIAELKSVAAEYDSKGQAGLIRRAIGALTQFTAKRKPSLDHAFGLVECRGKRKSAEKFDLACQAYQLQKRDARPRTWAEIAEQLDTIHKFNLDGDGLKMLVSRYKTEILAHFFKIDLEAALNDRA